MNSVDNDYINTYVVNKSKFISILCPVNNIEDITYKLTYYKDKYKNATHYCTAYIIDNYSKYNDDGEPSGTAGMPILNILKKNNLNHILCIVIRYFGGVKLGSGGLIRAYSTAVKEVIDISNIITLCEGYLITIKFAYNNNKVIDNLLENKVVKKAFAEDVYYTFEISKERFTKINDILEKLCTIIEKENILVQK